MSTETRTFVEEMECSIEQYFGDSLNSTSHSELDVFRDSPSLYAGRFLRRDWPQEHKTAFDVGTVFHDLILGQQYEVTWETFARLRTVAQWRSCPEPERAPDHVSKTGSRYWKCDDGCIRQSGHWGLVGNSFWTLKGHGLTGFCKYSHHLGSEIFLPIPADVLASNGAKNGNKWKEFKAANEGRILLKEDEFAPLAEMVASVKSNERAMKYLFEWKGKNERKFRWTDNVEIEPGRFVPIVRRAMLDAPRLPGEGDYPIIVDLKTCARMPTPEMFSKVAWQFGYARQCEWYKDAFEALTGDRPPFVFIVVLKQPPFTCRLFELNEEYVALARQQNADDLKRFAIARETNSWADDDGSILEVAPPNWAKYAPDWSIPID